MHHLGADSSVGAEVQRVARLQRMKARFQAVFGVQPLEAPEPYLNLRVKSGQ